MSFRFDAAKAALGRVEEESVRSEQGLLGAPRGKKRVTVGLCLYIYYIVAEGLICLFMYCRKCDHALRWVPG